jgi:Flp pilus assembly protein TadG
MTRKVLRRVPRPDRESGNAPLELVILAPVVVGLIGLAIAAGRTSIAQGSVDAAARDAARQASIARSPAAAQAAAQISADAAVAGDGLNCQPTVHMRLGGFGVPVGQPASVRAFVTCTVSLSNLAVPGLPGHKTLRASFVSPLDPFRGRSSVGLGWLDPAVTLSSGGA